jgi:hypothetical protein
MCCQRYSLQGCLFLGCSVTLVVRAIGARAAVFKTRLGLPWLAFSGSAGVSTLFARNQTTALFGSQRALIARHPSVWNVGQNIGGDRQLRAQIRRGNLG